MNTLSSPIVKFHSPETALTACEKYPGSVPMIDADGRFAVGRKTERNGMPPLWSYLREDGWMVIPA